AAPYVTAARRAAAFLRERMWNADGRRLLRRYRAGRADIDAYAEDYGCLIFGLLELFQADPDPMWLEWAIALQHRQDEHFWDDAGAGSLGAAGPRREGEREGGGGGEGEGGEEGGGGREGGEGQEGQQGLERALGRRYLPFAIQLRLTSEHQRRLSGSLPFIAEMKPIDGKTS